jgi:hypothetical protein
MRLLYEINGADKRRRMTMSFLAVAVLSVNLAASRADESPLRAMSHDLATARLDLVVDVASTWSLADDSAKQYTSQVSFKQDGETAYTRERTVGNDGSVLWMHTLCRSGELLRFQVFNINGNEHFVKTLVAPRLAGKVDESPPVREDVFSSAHFPVAGIIGGFEMAAYFPESASVTSSIDQNVERVQANTDFGAAEAWIDAARSVLPRRIKIVKGPNHLMDRSRRLGEVPFRSNEPNILMTELRLELKDIEYAQDPRGRHFIKSCVLTEEHFTERGRELETTTRWEVENFTYEPDFGEGIRPDVPIADGEAVELEGAPQLPYVWSEAERWVVPAQAMLAADGSAPRRVLIGVLATLVLVLLCAGLYRYKVVGRGKVRTR